MKDDERKDHKEGIRSSRFNWKRQTFRGHFRTPHQRIWMKERDRDHAKIDRRNQRHRTFYRQQFTRKKRGVFFFRFFGAFAIIIILIFGGMAAFAYLLSQIFDGGRQMATLVWISGCSLSLALPILALALGIGVYRGIATPIADVMSAAEAVAEGDFSVRVPAPKHGSDDFRRLAESFNRMISELSHLDQQRRNLTADVAHELRTPLHIIQGNLEGILDGVYQPTSEHINVLLDEIRILTRLVGDLQTLSLVEAGELTLNFEEVDILELLNDVQTSFSGQMETAKIDLQVRVARENSTEIPETDSHRSSWMISADPARLDQILTNLVANALRYTDEGGRITLHAALDSAGVIIRVQDTGEGISKEDLPFIFDRFWKGDRTRGRMEGTGSGLGLAISRKLVEAHEGLISVESILGEGTTFTINLPR